MRTLPNDSDGGESVAGAGTPLAEIVPRRVAARPLISAVITKVARRGPSPPTTAAADSVHESPVSNVSRQPERSNEVISDAVRATDHDHALAIAMPAGNGLVNVTLPECEIPIC